MEGSYNPYGNGQPHQPLFLFGILLCLFPSGIFTNKQPLILSFNERNGFIAYVVFHNSSIETSIYDFIIISSLDDMREVNKQLSSYSNLYVSCDPCSRFLSDFQYWYQRYIHFRVSVIQSIVDSHVSFSPSSEVFRYQD